MLYTRPLGSTSGGLASLMSSRVTAQRSLDCVCLAYGRLEARRWGAARVRVRSVSKRGVRAGNERAGRQALGGSKGGCSTGVSLGVRMQALGYGRGGEATRVKGPNSTKAVTLRVSHMQMGTILKSFASE